MRFLFFVIATLLLIVGCGLLLIDVIGHSNYQ